MEDTSRNSYSTIRLSFRLSNFTLIVRCLLLVNLQEAKQSYTKHHWPYSLFSRLKKLLSMVIEEDMIFSGFCSLQKQNEIHGQCLLISIKQYWARITLLNSPNVCPLRFCQFAKKVRWQLDGKLFPFRILPVQENTRICLVCFLVLLFVVPVAKRMRARACVRVRAYALFIWMSVCILQHFTLNYIHNSKFYYLQLIRTIILWYFRN